MYGPGCTPRHLFRGKQCSFIDSHYGTVLTGIPASCAVAAQLTQDRLDPRGVLLQMEFIPTASPECVGKFDQSDWISELFAPLQGGGTQTARHRTRADRRYVTSKRHSPTSKIHPGIPWSFEYQSSTPQLIATYQGSHRDDWLQVLAS